MANINESKKYHFIYKTTNLLNGKYYVGIHSTSNLKDGYLGSGKRLRRSIRKYGKSNFKLEILEFFSTREEVVKREKELVNEDLIKDSNCLNLKLGGSGGFTVESAKKGRAKVDVLLKTCYGVDFKKELGKRGGLIRYQRHGLNQNWLTCRASFEGRHHTEESKKRIGLNNSLKQKGALNSQFGSMWITNGVENRKVQRDSHIPEGWYKGRKL